MAAGTGAGDANPGPDPICAYRGTDGENEGEGDADGFLNVNGLVSAGPGSVTVPLGDRACCLRNAAAEIVRGPPLGLAPPPLFNDDVECAMSGGENGGVGRGYSGGEGRYTGNVGPGEVGESALPPPAAVVVIAGMSVGVGSRSGMLSLDVWWWCHSGGCASIIGDAPRLPRLADGGLGGRTGDEGTEFCGVLPKEEGCGGDDEGRY